MHSLIKARLQLYSATDGLYRPMLAHTKHESDLACMLTFEIYVTGPHQVSAC